ADKDGKLTSYDFADAILKKLASKTSFPNLRAIVVAGHSAGGQFVNRYEMANQVHDTLGVPITYVVANPSSYAYLDATRPSAAAAGGTEFRAFGDARNCTTYDKWPYGLQGRTGYASRMSDDVLKKQLVARPTMYLVGELDTLPLAGFDSSCPAMAQGANRNLRGQVWGKVRQRKAWGAPHDDGRPLVRPQRTLHVHQRQRACSDLSEALDFTFLHLVRTDRPYSGERRRPIPRTCLLPRVRRSARGPRRLPAQWRTASLSSP